jgi:hypothetical protein
MKWRTDGWKASFHPDVPYYILVCAPCLRHRCVCVREEKQIFFWFSHLPSFPSSFMFFLSTFLGMFYVPLCSQIIPNSTIFWQKISQMIFKNVLPCQVSISRERIYQCPLPLFTTVGYMTLTWNFPCPRPRGCEMAYPKKKLKINKYISKHTHTLCWHVYMNNYVVAS